MVLLSFTNRDHGTATAAQVADEEGAIMDLATCPECGNAAEILWRDVLESTDGPIEHAKVVCVDRHWFLMPVASLASPRVTARTSWSAVLSLTDPAPATEWRR